MVVGSLDWEGGAARQTHTARVRAYDNTIIKINMVAYLVGTSYSLYEASEGLHPLINLLLCIHLYTHNNTHTDCRAWLLGITQ